MKNKKTFMIFAMLIVTLLGGCQLAKEDEAAAQKPDVLCGVFVTLEPIEPVSQDTVIELPADWNGNINDVLFNEENSRIYATRHEREDGSADYTFDGVEGFRLFSITEMNPKGNETYKETIGDRQWLDVSSSYNETDNGSDVKLTGTLCFDVHYPCRVYTNPVYQTSDGRVYCTYGDGHFFDMPGQQPGEWGSTSISSTTTETVDGKAISRSLEATVKMTGANTNKQIVLKQMDSDDKVIEETVITPDDIPETLRVLPYTAYMILEEHGVDTDNKNVIVRTMVKADDTIFSVRFTEENGIIESYPVTLVH